MGLTSVGCIYDGLKLVCEFEQRNVLCELYKGLCRYFINILILTLLHLGNWSLSNEKYDMFVVEY